MDLLGPKGIEDTQLYRNSISLQGVVGPKPQLVLLVEILKRAPAGDTPVCQRRALLKRPAVNIQARDDDQRLSCESPGPSGRIAPLGDILNNIDHVAEIDDC